MNFYIAISVSLLPTSRLRWWLQFRISCILTKSASAGPSSPVPRSSHFADFPHPSNHFACSLTSWECHHMPRTLRTGFFHSKELRKSHHLVVQNNLFFFSYDCVIFHCVIRNTAYLFLLFWVDIWTVNNLRLLWIKLLGRHVSLSQMIPTVLFLFCTLIFVSPSRMKFRED